MSQGKIFREDDCMYDSIKLLLLNALNIDVANYNGIQVARRIMENWVYMEYIVKIVWSTTNNGFKSYCYLLLG